MSEMVILSMVYIYRYYTDSASETTCLSSLWNSGWMCLELAGLVNTCPMRITRTPACCICQALLPKSSQVRLKAGSSERLFAVVFSVCSLPESWLVDVLWMPRLPRTTQSMLPDCATWLGFLFSYLLDVEASVMSGEDPFELHTAANFLEALAHGRILQNPLLPIGRWLTWIRHHTVARTCFEAYTSNMYLF